MTARRAKPPRRNKQQTQSQSGHRSSAAAAGPKQNEPPSSDTGSGRTVRQTTAYLRNLFEDVGFTIDARKGQNFLVDLNLLDLLERSADVQPDDIVLEVGCGTAALTERLVRSAFHVVSAEIDQRLATLARDRLIDVDNVTVVEGDVLASKHRLAPAVLTAIDNAEAIRKAAGRNGRFLLVANLPYCVATPVISNLLLVRPFATATVTVQREMGERMIATAGNHAYNALSVWVGAQCRGEIVRILPPSAFWPRPKVDSAIVRLELEPDRRQLIANLRGFHTFVRDVFCHRRKVLRGTLIRLAGGKQQPEAVSHVDHLYKEFGFERLIRAEEINADTFVRLYEQFSANCSAGE